MNIETVERLQENIELSLENISLNGIAFNIYVVWRLDLHTGTHYAFHSINSI